MLEVVDSVSDLYVVDESCLLCVALVIVASFLLSYHEMGDEVVQRFFHGWASVPGSIP